MKGYKVFNSDWTCRGFQYEVGKTYKLNGFIKICERGFHFCETLVDCFDYYSFNPDSVKVAEVESTGKIIKSDSDSKCVTNEITIIKEIPWEEVVKMCNSGNWNSGNRNSGNRNSGNWNSGDCNSGDCNSGDCNSGDCNSGNWNSGNRNSGNRNSGNRNSGNRNSGNRNSGDCNSGNRNSGNRNSGNRNSGNWNSGDWNSGDWNSGIFNSNEQKISMFNRSSDWTMADWYNSRAFRIMQNAPTDYDEWIWKSDMTEDELKDHPEAAVTGGYLKHIEDTKRRQEWWDELDDEDKAIVKALPNFDPEIFKACTGIRMKED